MGTLSGDSAVVMQPLCATNSADVEMIRHCHLLMAHV